jgi:NADH-quinone oxidoreductase subunit A
LVADYLPIVLLLAIGAVVSAVMVLCSWLLGPKNPTMPKKATYECGVEPFGGVRERFPIKFFLVAMLFIVFDIESIFLYPWYTVFRSAGQGFKLFTLIEVGVFFLLLAVGYVYVIKKNAIDFDEGSAAEEEPAPGGVRVSGQREEEVA